MSNRHVYHVTWRTDLDTSTDDPVILLRRRVAQADSEMSFGTLLMVTESLGCVADVANLSTGDFEARISCGVFVPAARFFMP